MSDDFERLFRQSCDKDPSWDRGPIWDALPPDGRTKLRVTMMAKRDEFGTPDSLWLETAAAMAEGLQLARNADEHSRRSVEAEVDDFILKSGLSSIRDVEKHHAAVTEQLEIAEHAVSVAHARERECQQALEARKLELEQAIEEVKRLENEAASHKDERQKAEQEVAKVKKEVDILEGQKNELEMQLERQEVELRRLVELQQDLDVEMRRIATNLEQLRQEVAALASDLQRMTQEVQMLTNDIKNLERQISDLTKVISLEEAAIQRLEQEIEVCAVRITELTNAIRAAEASMERANNEAYALEREAAELESNAIREEEEGQCIMRASQAAATAAVALDPIIGLQIAAAIIYAGKIAQAAKNAKAAALRHQSRCKQSQSTAKHNESKAHEQQANSLKQTLSTEGQRSVQLEQEKSCREGNIREIRGQLHQGEAQRAGLTQQLRELQRVKQQRDLERTQKCVEVSMMESSKKELEFLVGQLTQSAAKLKQDIKDKDGQLSIRAQKLEAAQNKSLAAVQKYTEASQALIRAQSTLARATAEEKAADIQHSSAFGHWTAARESKEHTVKEVQSFRSQAQSQRVGSFVREEHQHTAPKVAPSMTARAR